MCLYFQRFVQKVLEALLAQQLNDKIFLDKIPNTHEWMTKIPNVYKLIESSSVSLKLQRYQNLILEYMKKLISLHNEECQIYRSFLRTHLHLYGFRYMDVVKELQTLQQHLQNFRNHHILQPMLETSNLNFKHAPPTHMALPAHTGRPESTETSTSSFWFKGLFTSAVNRLSCQLGLVPNLVDINNLDIDVNTTTNATTTTSRKIFTKPFFPSTNLNIRDNISPTVESGLFRPSGLIDIFEEHLKKLRDQAAFYFLSKSLADTTIEDDNQSTIWSIHNRFEQAITDNLFDLIILALDGSTRHDFPQKSFCSQTIGASSLIPEDEIYAKVKVHFKYPFLNNQTDNGTELEEGMLKLLSRHNYVSIKSYLNKQAVDGNRLSSLIKHLIPHLKQLRVPRDVQPCFVAPNNIKCCLNRYLDFLNSEEAIYTFKNGKLPTTANQPRPQQSNDNAYPFPSSSYPLTKPNIVDYLLNKKQPSFLKRRNLPINTQVGTNMRYHLPKTNEIPSVTIRGTEVTNEACMHENHMTGDVESPNILYYNTVHGCELGGRTLKEKLKFSDLFPNHHAPPTTSDRKTINQQTTPKMRRRQDNTDSSNHDDVSIWCDEYLQQNPDTLKSLSLNNSSYDVVSTFPKFVTTYLIIKDLEDSVVTIFITPIRDGLSLITAKYGFVFCPAPGDYRFTKSFHEMLEQNIHPLNNAGVGESTTPFDCYEAILENCRHTRQMSSTSPNRSAAKLSPSPKRAIEDPNKTIRDIYADIYQFYEYLNEALNLNYQLCFGILPRQKQTATKLSKE